MNTVHSNLLLHHNDSLQVTMTRKIIQWNNDQCLKTNPQILHNLIESLSIIRISYHKLSARIARIAGLSYDDRFSHHRPAMRAESL